MEIIGEEDIGQECKVLGISWNKANDEFVFELAKFASGFIEMARLPNERLFLLWHNFLIYWNCCRQFL